MGWWAQWTAMCAPTRLVGFVGYIYTCVCTYVYICMCSYIRICVCTCVSCHWQLTQYRSCMLSSGFPSTQPTTRMCTLATGGPRMMGEDSKGIEARRTLVGWSRQLREALAVSNKILEYYDFFTHHQTWVRPGKVQEPRLLYPAFMLDIEGGGWEG